MRLRVPAAGGLADDADAELRGPGGRGRRVAPRQEADRQPRALRPYHGGAVTDAELFRFRSVRMDQDPPIRQHAVHVEQQQADAGRLAREVEPVAGHQNSSVRQRS
jgi:hypothetical protein